MDHDGTIADEMYLDDGNSATFNGRDGEQSGNGVGMAGTADYDEDGDWPVGWEAALNRDNAAGGGPSELIDQSASAVVEPNEMFAQKVRYGVYTACMGVGLCLLSDCHVFVVVLFRRNVHQMARVHTCLCCVPLRDQDLSAKVVKRTCLLFSSSYCMLCLLVVDILFPLVGAHCVRVGADGSGGGGPYTYPAVPWWSPAASLVGLGGVNAIGLSCWKKCVRT